MNVLILRNGNLLDIMRADCKTPDGVLLSLLKSTLSFIYKERTNSDSPIDETRYMCKESEDKVHVYASYGLLSSITKVLKDNGYTVWLYNLTDKEKRYDKLVPELDGITKDSFRPRQEECFNAILKEPCGVIQAPTGFGKTYLLGLLCNAFPKEKIHICTKSVKLVREIHDRLSKVVDSVGMVGGGSKDLNKRVTVFTANSLSYSNGDAAFFFYDECHTAAAPTFVEKIMSIYTFSRRYGFTATPEGRGDGADALLEMMFGPLIFQMTYSDGVDKGLIAKIKVRWLQCNSAPSRGLNSRTPVYRNRYCIWENDYRNKLIAEDVRKNYSDSKVKVLILVSTVSHVFALKQYLPEFEVNYASMPEDTLKDCIRRGWCPSDYKPLKQKDKDMLFQRFLSGEITKVISTDVWNTGIDVPDLSVVYNVSGRVSRILNVQGAGRSSRLFADKEYGQVIDIRDNYAEYTGFSYARYNQYKDLGWEQEGFYSRFIKRD